MLFRSGHNTNRCMVLRHKIQDLIKDGTIPTPKGPNVGTDPLPNHPPADDVNALITNDEGPDPVFLITDAPRPRSIYARFLTNIRYGYTWGPSQEEDHFQGDSNDSYNPETEGSEDSEDSENSKEMAVREERNI